MSRETNLCQKTVKKLKFPRKALPLKCWLVLTGHICPKDTFKNKSCAALDKNHSCGYQTLFMFHMSCIWSLRPVLLHCIHTASGHLSQIHLQNPPNPFFWVNGMLEPIPTFVKLADSQFAAGFFFHKPLYQ